MTKANGRSHLFAFFSLFALGCLAAPLAAQDTPSAAVDSLPDAPGISAAVPAQASTSQPPEHQDPQQKRIFGIIPNFRAVTAGTKLPPQTVKDKFVTASQDSFDYSSLTLAAAVSLETYATNGTPEFGTGPVAFGRYFWHNYLDEISENYFVEFIFPVVTHEDTRYYSLGRGGFAKRAGYSLSRAFVTKTDSGKRTFNASEIIGAGASAGLSNLYYPTPERTFKNTADNWATSVGIDVLSFFVREFYPDIYHAMFHEKLAPATKP
jgi:hypothetical protein